MGAIPGRCGCRCCAGRLVGALGTRGESARLPPMLNCELSRLRPLTGRKRAWLRCQPLQANPLPSLPCLQMEEVLSLNEDYIFLRKVQKCQTGEGQKSTLLDCEKILKGFQDLQCKVHCCWVDEDPGEGGGGAPRHTHSFTPCFF